MATELEADIIQLNVFLRGELSAIETYTQCIAKLGRSPVQRVLIHLRESHVARAGKLRRRVATLGGRPATSSGPWGTFANLIQAGAELLGESAAISMLEEGEDHGRDLYVGAVKRCGLATRRFLESEIIPEQLRTHDSLSILQSHV